MGEFTALVLREEEGRIAAAVETLDDDALPEGDVTVGVRYSSVNYKDGMILGGIGRLVRSYPHVGGIDLAGVVEASDSPDYRPGDEVLLSGWRVGEAHWGGYATRARVRSEWLVPKPDDLDLRECMVLGTAGLTAMLAVIALEEHGLAPGGEGEVLVTGAAGGVGSIAVALLAALGYRVAASTGRVEAHGYLGDLGAGAIVDRAELEEAPKGPLASERWAAAIDCVGAGTLAHLLAGLRYGASCAAVGLAAGPRLETTVLPFLLRGVSLLGIDSVMCPKEQRLRAWRRLAEVLPESVFARVSRRVSLAEVPEVGGRILRGGVRGRTVVDLDA